MKSQVRIHCAESVCIDYDLCVTCFSQAKHSKEHNPRTHSFNVIEQHSVPIFTDDWGADEELLLLQGAETYGLGSWADIADHIGGYRTKEEVKAHYSSTYIESSNFPLPELADPKDTGGLEKISRDEFLEGKKRRVERRKEEVKALALAPPKQAYKSSVPACHEVAGYMPARLDFETEYANDAEEAVQNMQFEPGDGKNQETGELEPETELKMTVMDIYNERLTQRVEYKRVIFEHKLLQCKRIMAEDKQRIKEERDLLNKAKPLVKIINRADHQAFTDGLVEELNLRTAIGQLQEWRSMGIATLKTGARYEADKLQRQAAQKMQNMGQFDRLAGVNKPKCAPPETKSQTASGYVAPVFREPKVEPKVKPKVEPKLEADLAGGATASPILSLTNGFHHGGGADGATSDTAPLPSGSSQYPAPSHLPLTNGLSNNTLPLRTRFPMTPIPNISPLDLNDENAPDLCLLSEEERELCSVIRVRPRPYLVMKDQILRAAVGQGGSMKKKTCREICRIDTNKASRIHEFFVWQGWLGKG